jgi:hypothetical protein
MITNLADFQGYIKVMLAGGYVSPGVINVELSTEQINQCIEDAVLYSYRYLYGEATTENYMTLTLSAGVSAYSLSGANVASVQDISYSNVSQGVNVLFSPVNILFGGKFDFLNYSFSLTSYEVFNNYIKLVNKMFAVEYRLIYNDQREILTIVPTPNATLGTVLKVYTKQTMESLFNNVLVKGLALAKAKKVLSRAYMKYGSIELPGQGNLQSYGQSLLEEAKEEEKEFLDRLRTESEPIGIFWG